MRFSLERNGVPRYNARSAAGSAQNNVQGAATRIISSFFEIVPQRLNGKQVRVVKTPCLCCPRNGKRVWVYRYATGRKAWEGDTSRLVSPDTGLRANRRKCRGEADTVCQAQLSNARAQHLASFSPSDSSDFQFADLRGRLSAIGRNLTCIHVLHWQPARSR